jgi:transcriptional regulator with XRE-family HTH domain
LHHHERPDTQQALRAFGQAVRTVRLSRGLTQEQLAELADVHATYIGKIERAQKNISFENLLKLACALNLSLAELIARSDL